MLGVLIENRCFFVKAYNVHMCTQPLNDVSVSKNAQPTGFLVFRWESTQCCSCSFFNFATLSIKLDMIYPAWFYATQLLVCERDHGVRAPK